MVCLAEDVRSRWEAECERREIAELDRLARLLLSGIGNGLDKGGFSFLIHRAP